jgi:hypothetical protein
MLTQTPQNIFDRQSALYCRRNKVRAKLAPTRVTCWSAISNPRAATVVEADVRGARLVIPFAAKVGEIVHVCFGDHLGMHQTRRARVAWTHRLESANRLMVGLAFEEEMVAA